MNRFIIAQFFLLLALFAFLPHSIQQQLFVVEILLSFSYVLFNASAIFKAILIKGVTDWLPRLFQIFFILGVIYVIFSHFNLPKIWQINGLRFDEKYIPRHFFVVAELLIPVCVGYAMSKHFFVSKLRNWQLVVLSILGFSMQYIGKSPIPFSFIAIGSLSLYAARKHFEWAYIPILFYFTDQIAYIFAAIFLMFVCWKGDFLRSYFQSHTRFYLLVLTIVVILTIFSNLLFDIIQQDENALWRLRVWENELHSLAQTYFMGVGFGSAYVTENIYYEVVNHNMYLEEGGGLGEGLFIVANHNSFLNMFYRMGILGGILFICINILLTKWMSFVYEHATKENRIYLWWAFAMYIYETIIVLLNPGLEMMQFAINYLASLAVLLGIVIRTQQSCKLLLRYK